MPHVETPRPYIRFAEYPHLGPEDTAIWNRFIEKNPDRFLKVWYDFRVGDEDDIAPDHPANIRECWWDLTYWRIDVVAEDADRVYVIEIKPRANAKAIGQADAYAALFEEDESPTKPVKAVVITDVAIPTTLRVAAHRGVEIWTA